MRRKRIACFLLCAVCAAGTLPAYASADNANAPENSYLVKYLQQPEGTAGRGETFVFWIEPVYDSSAPVGDCTDMPGIFSCSLTPDTLISDVSDEDDDAYAAVSIAELFAEASFDHAGLYVYLVTEEADTCETLEEADGTLTYSDAAYQLNLYVEYSAESGSYEIKQVGVADLSDNLNGTQEENTAALKEGELDRGVKVDPQILPDADADEDEEGPYNRYDGFQFVNVYSLVQDVLAASADSGSEAEETDASSASGVKTGDVRLLAAGILLAAGAAAAGIAASMRRKEVRT